jgi:NAD+ diphosphatase
MRVAGFRRPAAPLLKAGMICFSGNPLDRAGDRRTDPAWLAAQRAGGLFLPFWQMKPLLTGDPPVIALLSGAAVEAAETCVFLGLDGAQALFAVDLGAGETPPLPGDFRDMRAAAPVLPARDAAIAGQAKALLDWHRRHRFCPNCGAATALCDGGYRRLCPQCGAEHFPRTDPVVIMLPLHADACLLGRNRRFAGTLFSAFAGFVEPGETVEEAVRRELREEANVTVGAVRYHASQPWPFPSSLMIGCYADAPSPAFAIDGNEIAEARWLTRAEARARLNGERGDAMTLPAPVAIAHHLIRDWAFAA